MPVAAREAAGLGPAQPSPRLRIVLVRAPVPEQSLGDAGLVPVLGRLVVAGAGELVGQVALLDPAARAVVRPGLGQDESRKAAQRFWALLTSMRMEEPLWVIP